MNISALLPIIESSTQIALGAGIAGIAAWITFKLRGGNSLSTEISNRRLQLLESIAEEVGNVAHIYAKYAALVVESMRFGGRWPEARRTELEEVSHELVAIFKKVSDAESKLLLLGEKPLAKTLRAYSARIAQFRKEVYLGRRDITDEQITELKREISKLREHFYDILSKKYDRLLVV